MRIFAGDFSMVLVKATNPDDNDFTRILENQTHRVEIIELCQ